MKTLFILVTLAIGWATGELMGALLVSLFGLFVMSVLGGQTLTGAFMSSFVGGGILLLAIYLGLTQSLEEAATIVGSLIVVVLLLKWLIPNRHHR